MARTSAAQKLGKKIRELRLELGLSQEKLGELTGIDRTYISGIERGVRNPALKNLQKIAKALNVKISELVDFWSLFDNLELERRVISWQVARG